MSASAYFVIILCLAVNTDASLINGIKGETDGGEESLLKRGPAQQTISDDNLIAAHAAPRNLRTVLATNTTISLQWDKPRTSKGPILKYRVSWKTSTSDDETDTINNSTSLKVDNLIPYQKYTFKVQAITASGPGEWSKELAVMTRVGVPHRPLRFRHSSVGNTTVGLEWLEPWPSTGPVISYRVRWDALFEHDARETNSTSFTVEKLEPYVNYTFKVRAITEAGSGEWSEDTTVQTDIGVPRLPRRFLDIGSSNTTIRLMWLEPWPSNGPILKYRVLWKNSTGSGEQDTNDNSTYFTMRRLTPYVEYTFEVLGITSAGPGETSDILKVRTEIGVPHSPVGLSATAISNTTVDLQWEKPEISTGPILEYRIHWKNSSSDGEVDTATSSTSFTMDKLTPDVSYTFKVLGITKAGPGQWSENLEVKTKLRDPCRPNPCKYGGQCKAGKCICQRILTGEFCEKCACLHGFCDLFRGMPYCHCFPEYSRWTDLHCKKCDCGKGINCVFGTQNWWDGGKTCYCKEGYNQDEGVCKGTCNKNPCKNGGECIVTGNDIECKCKAPFYGEFCEKDTTY